MGQGAIYFLSTFEQNNRPMISCDEGSFPELPSIEEYRYLHIIIAHFMLTNLRIFKYGLWIQYAVDKITNNYFTGTVKEIT